MTSNLEMNNHIVEQLTETIRGDVYRVIEEAMFNSNEGEIAEKIFQTLELYKRNISTLQRYDIRGNTENFDPLGANEISITLVWNLPVADFSLFGQHMEAITYEPRIYSFSISNHLFERDLAADVERLRRNLFHYRRESNLNFNYYYQNIQPFSIHHNNSVLQNLIDESKELQNEEEKRSENYLPNHLFEIE